MIRVQEVPGYKDDGDTQFTSPEKRELLRIMLCTAVPLWGDRLCSAPWSYVQQRSEACSTVVASKGDSLQFYTKGESAKAFNALAEGLACLAFAPGGVRFLGLHFVGTHPGNAS